MNVFTSGTKKATEVLQKQFSIKNAAIVWTHPREANFGDLSSSIALQVAKEAGVKPRDVADAIVRELSSLKDVEKAEVAGAGYVNVWLTPSQLLDAVSHAHASVTPLPTRKEPPVIIEYSQPNIAKPLGIHHLIGTVVGQAVSNLYEHLGYPVIRWNYLGDWGSQFGKLAVAMQKWGKGKTAKDLQLSGLLDLYVKFHDEAEKDPSLEDQGRAAFRKLEEGDAEMRAFWSDVLAVTKETLQPIYQRLSVHFDLDLGESFYEDKMEPVLTEGKKKGVFTEGKEGALIVEFSEESNLPPYMVLKGDGGTLYSTRDLAQMRYRMDTYKPQSILIFTDIAQKLHFEQLVETCKKLGWTLPHFENVLFGRMRFADKKMSTRKGNILKLEEVLDESVTEAKEVLKEHGEIQTDDPAVLAEMMGVGALVYGILSQNRKMDIVFDWAKMLSFDGNSAPYLQYTFARAKSVLRKAEISKTPSVKNAQACSQHERTLLRTLLQFPAVLEDARENAMPHKLATYLYTLCQDFNAFYNADPILKSEGEIRSQRLLLVSIFADVLNCGAQLLTLRLPERM